MERPLVSVVIPIYNVENYLDRCIQSVVDQSYWEMEILLIDDGSTDQCPAICDGWAKRDNRIQVIHKKNAGVGAARNTGIDSARGRYIFFLDGDDCFEIETIETCIAEASRANADVVMFGRCDICEDGTKIEHSMDAGKRYYLKDQILEDILPGLFTYERGLGISVCMKMFDLDLIKKNKVRFGEEREFVSEDACFILNLFSYVSSVLLVPKQLYYYRRNISSFSRRYKKNCQLLNDAFILRGMDICEKAAFPEKVLRCIKVRYHMYTVAGLKQILGAKLTKKEKKAELGAIYENKLLCSTITCDTLKYESFPMRFFWIVWKLRGYWICNVMLRCKAKG